MPLSRMSALSFGVPAPGASPIRLRWPSAMVCGDGGPRIFLPGACAAPARRPDRELPVKAFLRERPDHRPPCLANTLWPGFKLRNIAMPDK